MIADVVATLRLGGVAIFPLLFLAVVVAFVAIEKSFVFFWRARMPRAVANAVEAFGADWQAFERLVSALDSRNLFRGFFRVLLDNRARPVWWIESRLTDEAGLIEGSLTRGLWVLETIVTAAPLLGLLGTIAGMIRAFKLFGNQGLVDPSGVTGGVAQALIATALGLFIALVALFAFNYLSQRQARIMDEIDRLGTRLIDQVRLYNAGQDRETA